MCVSPLMSQTLDINQPVYAGVNDIVAREGYTGQTFTPTKTAKLIGIRLWIAGKKWSGDYPFGSDLTLSLRHVVDGFIQPEAITTGTLSREDIPLNAPAQFDIYFSKAYTQLKGELLAFTLYEESGGGRNGWNEYGIARDDVYGAGTLFYVRDRDEPVLTQTNDFAFATIIDDRTQLSGSSPFIDVIGPTQFQIILPVSDTNKQYTLEWTTDLETWRKTYKMPGSSDPLVWKISSTASKSFFRINED